jgi:hypothetical protein
VDTLLLTDQLTRQWTLARQHTEAVQLQDLLRRATSLSQLESLSLEDLAPGIDYTAGQVSHRQTVSDTLACADAVRRGMGKQVVESVQLADSLLRSWQLARLLTEAVGLSDGAYPLQQLHRSLADYLVLTDLAPGTQVWKGVRRQTVTEYLQLLDAAPVVAVGLVRGDTVSLVDSVLHGNWQIYRLLTEAVQLADTFSTDLYGPFYGTLTLHRLATDLDLQQLLSTLTLAQLRAVLTLSEEP